MRGLFAKLAVATGSAVLGIALLVVCYVSAGAFVLSGLMSAVFLIGARYEVVQNVFAPIALSSGLIFAASSWGLTALGVGTWWLWRSASNRDGDKR
jgi:hypothetical protein